ncbi:AAA family ATPase [Microbacterium oxydans]|uniref:AAA family ATPase n=1 Tax=Microbacterium oxydans TaxID=82380 RepID=UPI000F8DFDDB|nr:AAA family ATPase [Microbacterium oxydans]
MNLRDILPEELNYPRPRLPYGEVWRHYADAGLCPVPVQDTPPTGFQKWSRMKAEQWATNHHWAYAQTAITLPGGLVILDDDDAEQVSNLEAELGQRPTTLYGTSRGAGAPRRKSLYRVPDGSRFVGEYTGGEVIDSRHRFAFVCPTVNRKTGTMEEWYAPDDSPLERFPTAEDLSDMVAELPTAWVAHLTSSAPLRDATRPYEGPATFEGGELSARVIEVSERHPDTSHYPDANSALMSLAWVAVRFPEAAGIETLRAQIVNAYVMRPDAPTSPDERQASMDRAWASALTTQAAQHEADWAEIEAEVGAASAAWYRSQVPRALAEPTAFSEILPDDAHKRTGKGDFTAFERAVMGDASGYAEERAQKALEGAHTERSSWSPTDLTDVLDPDYTPPMPTIFRRTDRRALFYAGKVNEIHGTDGDGKTMVALAAVAETLIDGSRVLYIDHEESPSVIVSRLRLYGVPIETIRLGLDYVQPEGTPTPSDLSALEAEGYALVVIDTVNESISTLTGGDSNNSDDLTRWHSLIRPFARCGPCVLVIDHITKDAANPLYPIGSQAKRAGYKGLVYLLEAPKSGGLVEGGQGHLRLKLAKGNSGGLGLKRGALAAEFHLDSSGSVATWELRAPDDSEQLAESAAEVESHRRAIWEALIDNGGSVESKAELWRLLTLGTNGAPWAKAALFAMITDGFVIETKGKNGGKGLRLASNKAPTPEADAEHAMWDSYPANTPDPTTTPSPLSVRGDGDGGQSEATDHHAPHSVTVSDSREGLPRSPFEGISDDEIDDLFGDALPNSM